MKSLPLALMALTMPTTEIESFLFLRRHRAVASLMEESRHWSSEAFEPTGITNRDPEV